MMRPRHTAASRARTDSQGSCACQPQAISGFKHSTEVHAGEDARGCERRDLHRFRCVHVCAGGHCEASTALRRGGGPRRGPEASLGGTARLRRVLSLPLSILDKDGSVLSWSIHLIHHTLPLDSVCFTRCADARVQQSDAWRVCGRGYCPAQLVPRHPPESPPAPASHPMPLGPLGRSNHPARARRITPSSPPSASPTHTTHPAHTTHPRSPAHRIDPPTRNQPTPKGARVRERIRASPAAADSSSPAHFPPAGHDPLRVPARESRPRRLCHGCSWTAPPPLRTAH